MNALLLPELLEYIALFLAPCDLATWLASDAALYRRREHFWAHYGRHAALRCRTCDGPAAHQPVFLRIEQSPYDCGFARPAHCPLHDTGPLPVAWVFCAPACFLAYWTLVLPWPPGGIRVDWGRRVRSYRGVIVAWDDDDREHCNAPCALPAWPRRPAVRALDVPGEPQ